MQFANPDLHLLRVFMTVVECGSFRAAQSVLGLGASSISMNIKKLENNLGFRLCSRGKSGLVLTPGGVMVLEAAQRMLGAISDYNAEVTRARGQALGEVNICICDAMLSNIAFPLHDAIAKLAAAYPGMSVKLDTLPPMQIERRVMDGQYDVGISSSFRNIDGLIYESLFSEKQTLVCGAGHRLFASCPDDVDEALLGAEQSISRSYMTAVGLKSVPPIGMASASVNSMEAAALMILTGRYIGYLPDHYAALYISRDQMREILPERTFYRSKFFVMAKKSHLSHPVRRFIDEIVRLRS